MTRALLPNSTQVPDVILDFWLAEVTGAELKVVLYVARRTYGFGKKRDRISLNQLTDGIVRRDGSRLDTGTGLSRSAVKVACANLVKRGMLLKTSNSRPGLKQREENTFELNLNWGEKPCCNSPTGLGQKEAHLNQGTQDVGQKMAHLGHKLTGKVGRKLTLQETEDLQDTAAQRQRLAADELVSKLMAYGMNGDWAVRLASTRPLQCRKQIEFHEYRLKTGFVFKVGQARFLRRAIECDYAEPEGLAKTQRVRSSRALKETKQEAKLSEIARSREALKDCFARFEIEYPNLFSEYTAYKTERTAKALSSPIVNTAPRVRDRLVKSLNSDEGQLECLAQYFRAHGCPFPEYRCLFIQERVNAR